MEFVQFHPTALDTPENPLQLISEAVRGEGAMLVNDRGVRFMTRRHRLAELAPRDIVAREIFRERQGGSGVYLDARKIARTFARRFPGIFAICPRPRHRSAEGPDSRHARGPLHDGRRHDRPRGPLLRSSGCTRAARSAAPACTARTGSRRTRCSRGSCSRSAWRATSSRARASRARREASRGRCLRCAIAAPPRSPWTASGSSCGTTPASTATRRGSATASTGSRTSRPGFPPGATEEQNMVDTAHLIAEAALMRKESRGGHFRRDFPKEKRKWRGQAHRVVRGNHARQLDQRSGVKLPDEAHYRFVPAR